MITIYSKKLLGECGVSRSTTLAFLVTMGDERQRACEAALGN